MRTLGICALLFAVACSGGTEMAAPGGSGGATAGAGGAGGSGGAKGSAATGARVRFTLDGVTKEVSGSLATLSEHPPRVSNGVTATFPTGEVLSLTWTGSTTGKFEGDFGFIVWMTSTGNYACGFKTDGSCVITVTDYDSTLRQRVAGTFRGTLKRTMGAGADTITITDGSFELPQ